MSTGTTNCNQTNIPSTNEDANTCDTYIQESCVSSGKARTSPIAIPQGFTLEQTLDLMLQEIYDLRVKNAALENTAATLQAQIVVLQTDVANLQNP